jgi:tRNA (cytidine/uridine-2'-O-)-methyltransferase
LAGLEIAPLLHALDLRVYAANWRCFPHDRFEMRIALYQPDIPQNTGTILRLAACLNVAVDIIEPAGFDLSDRALKRAALDYIEAAEVIRHREFGQFRDAARAAASRIVLLTSMAETPYIAAKFQPNDILLVGRESAGVPGVVRDAADLHLRIPMRSGLRSLNVAVALAMVLGEGLRQTGGFSSLA